ncbi:hypothetical protein NMY22_g4459 [Coprinellus aureogranulatus]|nr:hypothetical protein NMY22_g4459 [Coprinellus aureogranulatus]
MSPVSSLIGLLYTEFKCLGSEMIHTEEYLPESRVSKGVKSSFATLRSLSFSSLVRCDLTLGIVVHGFRIVASEHRRSEGYNGSRLLREFLPSPVHLGPPPTASPFFLFPSPTSDSSSAFKSPTTNDMTLIAILALLRFVVLALRGTEG